MAEAGLGESGVDVGEVFLEVVGQEGFAEGLLEPK